MQQLWFFMAQLQRIAIAPSQVQGNHISLTAEQQHYLSRVLRLTRGDRFIAMDGLGKWWLAQLFSESAEILEPLPQPTELPLGITLMAALPKGNSFDEVVRFCTELGVYCIAPILSDRTLINPSAHKVERWRRIATEAAEQSERVIVPTVLEPVSFNQAIASHGATNRYLCEARGNYPHLHTIIKSDLCSQELVIATGPEGGWHKFHQ